MKLNLDNTCLEDYGLILESDPDVSVPERDIAYTSIPGRMHGSLTQKLGWKDLTIQCDVACYSFTSIKKLLRNVHGLIFDAATLWFDDDPDFYYKIKSVKIGSAPIDMQTVAKFQLVFTCDPFIYQNTWLQSYGSSFNMNNDSVLDAEPYWKIYGNGDIQLSVNGMVFKIEKITDYVEIDSQALSVYKGNTVLDTSMTGDFPILKPGINEIKTVSGNVTKIEIDPRWMWLP
ncbi:hypothetical protein GKC32_09490 [Lactobacillus curvatus]|nr:hypothetical protein [Latilactobacillus curvatus]MSD84765.1 hypothetical protein [Latilactobacillus curvatus]MSE24677.1 hypothetical protein [Latilactobacillus curvatus]